MELSTHNGLAYGTAGSGPTIMVLHGGLGLDHQYLRPLIDDLATLGRVVWLDHRGNGQSAAPDDWSSVTMDTMADDIDGIRAAVGAERMFLFGHSYGGFLALSYALRHPERLDGLMLANTAAHIGHPPNIPEDAPPAAVAAFSSLFQAPMESDEQWAATWTAAFPLYGPDLDAETAAAATSRTVYRADALNRSFALLGDYDVSGDLARIAAPTLLLSGGRDFLTGVAGHEELRDGIPDAELVVFDGGGHFPFLSDREGYRSAVEDWLRRQPAYSGAP